MADSNAIGFRRKTVPVAYVLLPHASAMKSLRLPSGERRDRSKWSQHHLISKSGAFRFTDVSLLFATQFDLHCFAARRYPFIVCHL